MQCSKSARGAICCCLQYTRHSYFARKLFSRNFFFSGYQSLDYCGRPGPRSKEDRVLRHRRGGGRHTQGPDEQLLAVHQLPDGDPELGQQDPRNSGDHKQHENSARILFEFLQRPPALHQQMAHFSI